MFDVTQFFDGEMCGWCIYRTPRCRSLEEPIHACMVISTCRYKEIPCRKVDDIEWKVIGGNVKVTYPCKRCAVVLE